ncbi:MAG: NosL family protein [Desulfobacteraceae bacterium]|nr:MAG: NosL family protein [Desulfobacteraceae bacterium]
MMRKFRHGIFMTAMAAALMVLFSGSVTLAQDESCRYCGMKKSMFGHSWVVFEHDDGSKAGFCSIHCAAIHMALNIDKPVTRATVGDYSSKNQIDADKAHWVIGGDKMGVMTTRAKWAFETKESSDKFMSASGGRPATYEEAIKAAFEDMYEDTLMIQKRRKAKRMQMKP